METGRVAAARSARKARHTHARPAKTDRERKKRHDKPPAGPSFPLPLYLFRFKKPAPQKPELTELTHQVVLEVVVDDVQQGLPHGVEVLLVVQEVGAGLGEDHLHVLGLHAVRQLLFALRCVGGGGGGGGEDGDVSVYLSVCLPLRPPRPSVSLFCVCVCVSIVTLSAVWKGTSSSTMEWMMRTGQVTGRVPLVCFV